jgi:transcriptional repressor NrdR
VMKKDGSLEVFDKDKVRRGLIKATWKRPVKIDEIDALVNEVELKLRSRKTTTVRSWEIGRMVINRLKKIDPLGYLLFASVYRDFGDLDDFQREIQELKKQSIVNRV